MKLNAFLRVAELRAIKRFMYLGEQCVKLARENGDYIDQTGNLRASVGYVLYNHGQIISSNFGTGSSNMEGAYNAMAVANEAASKHPTGLCLVVVAGMNYAAAVESRGRDVLASTEIYAMQTAPKMIEQLKANISKAFDI